MVAGANSCNGHGILIHRISNWGFCYSGLFQTAMGKACNLRDSPFDSVANFDQDFAIGRQEYIHPAAKFYKSKFFTAA